MKVPVQQCSCVIVSVFAAIEPNDAAAAAADDDGDDDDQQSAISNEV